MVLSGFLILVPSEAGVSGDGEGCLLGRMRPLLEYSVQRDMQVFYPNNHSAIYDSNADLP